VILNLHTVVAGKENSAKNNFWKKDGNFQICYYMTTYIGI